MPRRRARALSVVLAVTAALGALAACGRPEPAPDVASVDQAGAGAGATPEPSLSPEDRRVKFAQCMREHGVPLEDNGGAIRIGGPDSEIDLAQAEAAMQACRQYSPFGEGGPGADPQTEERIRQFARCMRERGVEDFPDPDAGRMRIDGRVADDPDFPAAQRECGREFLPSAPAVRR
jgi:hypothetical protein